MKTTVVNGVLTSYELMLAILFRWRVWSCSHDIVCLWCSHGSGHGLDHHTLATWYCAIAYLPLLNCDHSIFRQRCRHFVIVVLSSSLLSLYHPYLFLIISTLGNAVYPRRLCAYCCVHWEWRAQICICFGSHNNYSGSCGVPSDILGWRMARWARLSRNQGIAHPWSSYGGLKMLW